MKRRLFAMFMGILMLLSGTALGEETIETPLDKYWSHEIIDIEDTSLELSKVPTEDDHIGTYMGAMLFNLYIQETQLLGKSVDESVAVDIYRGMQQEGSVASFTAVNQDAVLLNGIFAKNDGDFADVYWFEYNLETYTQRVGHGQITDKAADAEDFLNDYVYFSDICFSLNTSALIGIPSDAIWEAYRGDVLVQIFDAFYKKIYGTSPEF